MSETTDDPFPAFYADLLRAAESGGPIDPHEVRLLVRRAQFLEEDLRLCREAIPAYETERAAERARNERFRKALEGIAAAARDYTHICWEARWMGQGNGRVEVWLQHLRSIALDAMQP